MQEVPLQKTHKSEITLLNIDCMQFMATLPDKAFDLAVVDPQFGIGIGRSPRLVTDKGLEAKEWDDKPIDDFYFTELFRVSLNQIIWGGNYYNLPPTKHCIIWDKLQPEKLSFGMFDYAWTSFETANKAFRRSPSSDRDRIHPTQKPVALFEYLIRTYTNEGDTVMDNCAGSGTTGMAAFNTKRNAILIEKDEIYFNAAKERFDRETRQVAMW